MANLITLQGSDPIKGSRETINQNFIAVMSDFAGTSFPTENLAVGMKFYNTDEKKVYRLTALPNTWEEEKSASTWNEIEGKPNFAVVATSGSYNDLKDKPTIKSYDNEILTINNMIAAISASTGNEGNRTLWIGMNEIYQKGGIGCSGAYQLADGSTPSWIKDLQVGSDKDSAKYVVTSVNGVNADNLGNVMLDIPSTDNFVQQSDVANVANKIPRYNSEGHLVLPSGAEIW
jgi:hypothetical protein